MTTESPILAFSPHPGLTIAFERLRAGDAVGAQAVAQTVLAKAPDDPAVLAFLGMLLCRGGNPADGANHLRRALEQWPHDLATRVNLATALAAMGAFDEVALVCAGGLQNEPRLRRLASYVDQQQGRLVEAEAGYVAVVAAVPEDFESWNNLGNVRAACGKIEDGIEAFERAIELRPDLPILYINLAKLLAKADRHEDRQTVMRAAARVAPTDSEVQAELGLAESALHLFDPAERAYREALRLDPGNRLAYIELGLLLENLNRIDSLAALVTELEEAGVTDPELDFVKAWLLRRQNRFAEAMRLAETVPDTVQPLRRAQLVAELADRLGEAPRAFASFGEMNRAAAELAPIDWPAEDYREEVVAIAAMTVPENIAKWSKINVRTAPAPPIFVVGFPRSGTTLLDTLLMNIPDLHVMEEQPVMRQVEALLRSPDRIGNLNTYEAQALRKSYFEAVRSISPRSRSMQTIVDKYPLHMARMPLIHRIFPDAKVVMVERHPCDVVLSCFMSNFTLNKAMRHFGTLEGAAKLYDTVFDAWTRAVEFLPIDVHRIRYENMIDDLENEMRALLSFLDLPWDPAVLDNQGSAAKRGHISTASYAQVVEPIYTRSSGRWTRYRLQMQPVIPLLAPWAERMDYPL